MIHMDGGRYLYVVTLINRCENGLMSFVNMKNCIRFYQTAEEIQAELLKNHCSELISNHWVSIDIHYGN